MTCLFGRQFHIPLSYLVFALLRFCILIQVYSILFSSEVNTTLLLQNTSVLQHKPSNSTSDSSREYIDNSLENKTNLYPSKLQIQILKKERDVNKSSTVESHLGNNTQRSINVKHSNRTRQIKSRNISSLKKNTTTETITAVKQVIDHNEQSNVAGSDNRPRANNTATSGLHRITKAKSNIKSRPRDSPSSKNNTYLAYKNARGSKKKQTISILGLFELTESNNELRLEGLSELEAAKLAVQHVNKKDMLYGYDLELHANDTKVRHEFIIFIYFLQKIYCSSTSATNF